MQFPESPAIQHEPISEKWRLKAEEWVELDSAARLLEATKSAIFAQMQVELGDIPVSHAERKVRASPAWIEHVEKIEQARTKANVVKVERDYLRMKHSEQQNADANRRQEMRL